MNPIMLDLGIISIHWYSFLIFIALIIGGWMVIREAKKWNISEDFIINLAFYLIPISLIGARLYFVVFHWDYYSQNLLEIFEVWKGGLAIHGALLFGLLFVLFYCKKHKIHTLRLLDIIVVSLLLGQAIGRWGNFINQEAFGPATTLSFLESLHLPQFIIDGMYIGGTYYQPTFLYESLWCIIGFIAILFIRRMKYIKTGQITAFYLVWYGIGRFFIEGLRTDSLMLGPLKMAQVVSIMMILAGIILFFIRNRGSRFQNRYNDKENIENGTL